jgi:hypothetical protein
MKLRNFGLALVLAVAGFGVIAPAAQARDYDRYRDARFYRGRDRDEIRRRELLRDRLFETADRVRLAEREGDISRREADRLYRELDDVRDFLRNDRYLTETEFRRRMEDLDDVQRDFRNDRRSGRRYGRYDDSHDRYDRRYRDRY